MATDRETKKIRNACGLLYLATRPIRILTHLSWPAHIRESFFARNAKELPIVEYPDFDPSETMERLILARSCFRFSPMINEWLNITAYNTARSLQPTDISASLGKRHSVPAMLPDVFWFSESD